MTTIAAASSLVRVLAWQAEEVSVQGFNKPDFDKRLKPALDVAYWAISPVDVVTLSESWVELLTVIGPMFNVDTSDWLDVEK